MKRFHVWREKVLDVRQSAVSGQQCYTLGDVRGGYVIRIPVRLAIWFARREERREAAQSDYVEQQWLKRRGAR